MIVFLHKQRYIFFYCYCCLCPWIILANLVVVHQPKIVAKAIHDVVYWENFGIGCVALIIHPQLPSKDFVFITEIQKYLSTDEMVPAMVLRGNKIIPPEMKQRCQRQTTIIVAMYNDPGLNHLMDDATHDKDFMSTMFWLILLRSGVINNTRNLLLLLIQNKMEITFQNVYIDLKSSVLVLDLDSGKLAEIYRIYEFGPMKIVPLAQWEKDNDTQVYNFHWIKMRYSMIRSQLDGHTIRAVAQNNYLSQLEWNKERGVYEMVGGYYEKVWRYLESRMNFTTSFNSTTLSGWSVKRNGNKWMGIETHLQNNYSEAVVSPVINIPDKQKGFFVSWPIYIQRYYLFVKDPMVDNIIPWSNYLEPFNFILWIMLGLCVLFLALSIQLVAFQTRKINNYYLQIKNFTLVNVLFHTFRIFCNQGQELEPKTSSLRIVILTGYSTAFLLFSSYSAVLISFLATDHVSLPFDSFESILKDGSYQLGVIKNSNGYIYLSESRLSYLHNIWSRLMNTSQLNFPSTLEQAWRRVCQERYAFLLPTDQPTPIYMDAMPCRMRVLKPNYIYVRSAFAFVKNFPFQSLIQYHIQDMKDSGILKRIANEWKEEMEKNFHWYSSTSTITVTFFQITPLIIFLTIAIAMSIIIFLIEKQFNKIKRNKKSK